MPLLYYLNCSTAAAVIAADANLFETLAPINNNISEQAFLLFFFFSWYIFLFVLDHN
jgi:hypothetical protein